MRDVACYQGGSAYASSLQAPTTGESDDRSARSEARARLGDGSLTCFKEAERLLVQLEQSGRRRSGSDLWWRCRAAAIFYALRDDSARGRDLASNVWRGHHFDLFNFNALCNVVRYQHLKAVTGAPLTRLRNQSSRTRGSYCSFKTTHRAFAVWQRLNSSTATRRSGSTQAQNPSLRDTRAQSRLRRQWCGFGRTCKI